MSMGRNQFYEIFLVLLVVGCVLVIAFDILPRIRTQRKAAYAANELHPQRSASEGQVGKQALEFVILAISYLVITISLIYMNVSNFFRIPVSTGAGLDHRQSLSVSTVRPYSCVNLFTHRKPNATFFPTSLRYSGMQQR